MANKLSYEYIKSEFVNAGCELLDAQYVHKDKIMSYICNCGNKSTISWNNFKKGRRCKECGIKKSAAARRLNYEYVEDYFLKNNCKLLEKKYKNNQTSMEYICKCGQKSTISWNNFKKGRRCQKCKAKINSEKQRLDFSYVKNYIENDGHILLSKEYVNNQSNLEVQCPKGHKVTTQFILFQQGYKCRKCGIQNRSGYNHWKWISDRGQLKLDRSFAKRCRTALASTLKAIGKKKKTKSYEMLGYNYKDLQQHIFNHPNWEKVKDKNWELDHIFPVKAFVDYKLKEVHHIKIINNLDNLQPLTQRDNAIKHDKHNKIEFEIWLKNKGIEFN